MSELRNISLDDIIPPARPIRDGVDLESLKELIDSIREIGLENPIKVRPIGHLYEIVHGHRRYLAAKALGWATIPAFVESLDDQNTLRKRFHENLYRQDLNPVEEGMMFSALLEGGEADVDEICRITGKSRSYVYQRLQLVKGDPEVRDAVREGKITPAHAKELNRIPDDRTRKTLLQYCVSSGYTSTYLRREVDRILGLEVQTTPPIPPDVLARIMEEMPRIIARCYFCQAEYEDKDLARLRCCEPCYVYLQSQLYEFDARQTLEGQRTTGS